MFIITHTRIVIATLGAAGILGTGAAVAAPAVMGSGAQPGMQNQGTSAMQQEAQPAMQGEGVLAGMTSDAQPGMQNQVILTGIVNEARPATIPSE